VAIDLLQLDAAGADPSAIRKSITFQRKTFKETAHFASWSDTTRCKSMNVFLTKLLGSSSWWQVHRGSSQQARYAYLDQSPVCNLIVIVRAWKGCRPS
jgi:hypothetical protein